MKHLVNRGAGYLIFVTMLLCSTRAYSVEVINIPIEAAMSQRILFFPATKAVANVILFPGGDGIVGIKTDGGVERPNHTFTRSMSIWDKHGVNAVLFDASESLGNHGEYRNRDDHLNRITAVIASIRKMNNLPVWLVGHSNGTLSVSNYINASSDNEIKVDGLVILGTEHTVDFKRPLKLPILAVHHVQDACNVTPIAASVRVIAAAKLTSPRAEMIRLDGGREESVPCKARSYHGFLGIEDELIGRVSSFIKENLTIPSPVIPKGHP